MLFMSVVGMNRIIAWNGSFKLGLQSSLKGHCMTYRRLQVDLRMSIFFRSYNRLRVDFVLLGKLQIDCRNKFAMLATNIESV